MLIHRELTLKNLAQAMLRAILSSGMVMFLIATAAVMSWVVTREQIGMKMAGFFLDYRISLGCSSFGSTSCC